ncbi:MAG TPA: hypothetical protein VN824_07155, partial [Puia sp.]|nr:hypothetical protein [Puia sp.]
MLQKLNCRCAVFLVLISLAQIDQGFSQGRGRGQQGGSQETPALLKDAVIDNIVKEETNNSQLQQLAHELFDGIGPRLVGTPQMEKANEWAVAKYTGWGITARNEKWGEWHGWERGISHIDMVYPRIKSLEGTQLAWSPGMGDKTITSELVILPDLE